MFRVYRVSGIGFRVYRDHIIIIRRRMVIRTIIVIILIISTITMMIITIIKGFENSPLLPYLQGGGDLEDQ